MIISVLLAGAAMSAVQDTNPAPAQENTAPATDAQSGQPAASSSDDSGDIVVTAQRRSQRLSEVPMSISAADAERLQTLGITSTTDLTRVTPGLVFSANGANPQPAIRGVVTTSVSIGDSSNIALYVDGVYISNQYSTYQDFNNIDRVEVLKGPQGSLYGRNATGGAIIVVTRTPSDQFEVDGDVSYGSYNQRMAHGYVTGGLAKGVTADLALSYNEDDGYVKDIVTGKHLQSASNFGARSKLRFELADNLIATLAVDYSRLYESVPYAAVPLNGNTSAVRTPGAIFGRERGEVALSGIPYTRNENVGAALTTEWHPGKVNITSVTAYRHNDNTSFVDTDMSNLPLTSTLLGGPTRTYTQEVYGTTSLGIVDLLAGVFYIDDLATRDPSLSTTGSTSTNTTARAYTNAISPYAELTLHVGSHINLIGGLRYNHESRKVFNERDGIPRLSCTPSVPPAPATVCARATFNSTTYRLTAQYRVNSKLNFYLTNSTGFKSGVFNASAFDGTPVRPETITSWQGGVKARLGGLNLTGELFHYDYRDLQVVRSLDPSTGSTLLQNAANAKIKGAEISIDGRLNNHFSTSLGLAYLDAKYTDFPAASIVVPQTPAFCASKGASYPCGNVNATKNVSGFTMIRAPRWSGNANINYTTPLGRGDFRASASLYYSSKFYWDVADRLTQPSYATLRLEMGWTAASRRWGITAYADNVTDTTYFAFVNSSTAGDRATYAAPRRFGARFNWKLN